MIFVPDRLVGDVHMTGDGRDMYCCCVESGEGDGSGEQFKLSCGLQGEGSSSTGRIPESVRLNLILRPAARKTV